jgi:hypothetical protein
MALTDAEPVTVRQWLDDNPFYLIIVLDDGRLVEQDLAERGWIAKLNEQGFMRDPGNWYLARKNGIIVGTMVVHPGEQPYYMARHVGFTASSGNEDGPKGETVAYGIGKKRLDGHVDRLWFMSNGCVTLGDDLEPIAIRLLKLGQL